MHSKPNSRCTPVVFQRLHYREPQLLSLAVVSHKPGQREDAAGVLLWSCGFLSALRLPSTLARNKNRPVAAKFFLGQGIYSAIFYQIFAMSRDSLLCVPPSTRHSNVSSAKKFQCEYPRCQEKFHTRSAMKSHSRLHTGERPYRCAWPGYPKRYRWRSSLRYHRQTHGDSFSPSSRRIKHSNQYSPSRRKLDVVDELSAILKIYNGRPRGTLEFDGPMEDSRRRRCHVSAWLLNVLDFRS